MPNYGLGKDSALMVGCWPVGLLNPPPNNGAGTEGLEVYPNPASSYIEVRCEKVNGVASYLAMTRVEMYNAVGQCVYRKEVASLRQLAMTIDVSGFAKGVYYVRCEGISKKVIIE